MKDPLHLAVIRCAKGMSPHWKYVWEVKDIQGTWHPVVKNLTCSMGKWRSSRSPLRHVLLPEEGPLTSCHIHETPWPQRWAQAGSSLQDMEGQKPSVWDRFCHCPSVPSLSAPELQAMQKLEEARSCPSVHLSPSILYHHLAQAHTPFLHLRALGFPHGVECSHHSQSRQSLSPLLPEHPLFLRRTLTLLP